MAEEDDTETLSTRPEFPTGRIKKIVKLDQEINKITSEALLLVSRSTEMFLGFLAERSAEATAEKKRKTVKLDHLLTAVKRHQPTADFLLDSLPLPELPAEKPASDKQAVDKAVPAATRRIDDFFSKPAGETPFVVDS